MRKVSLLLAAFSLISQAQDRQDTVPVTAELITVDDGLPQGLVASIVQDSIGFIWFATKDGLTRYDGYEYRVFRHVPGDSTTLSGNHITALYEDVNGLLWVGTESDGVNRYDPRTGRFTRVRPEPFIGDIGGVVKIGGDGSGNIWVHEFGGKLLVITDTGDARSSLPVLRDPQMLFPGLAVGQVRDLHVMPDGGLWLLEKQVLKVWELREGRYVNRCSWQVPWPWRETDYPPGLVHHRPADRMLLVWERNAVRFDVRSCTVVDTLHLPELQLRGAGLVVDGKDRLWGKGKGSTWFRMDLRNGRLEFLRPELSGAASLPQEGVYCWMLDRTGNIWAGTPGYGVLKYQLRTERFHRVLLDGRPLHHSTIMRADAKGEVLLGVGDQVRLNTGSGLPERDPMGDALQAAGLRVEWGTCARDPRGDTWFGGRSGALPVHLFRFDHRHGRIVQVTHGANDLIVSVFPGTGHELWAIQSKDEQFTAHQLLRFDSRTGTRTGAFDFPGPIKSGTYREIACWRIAPDGALWMATGHGVYAFHPGSGAWRHFQHDPADDRSLPEDIVFALCFDPEAPQERLWVGSKGHGMTRMDMRTGRCDTTITTAQGLVNNVVYGILPDGKGELWVSTNRGLCRFNPAAGTMMAYTSVDGIAGNEFNRYSAERSADGRLFFGGMKGITWFDPADFHGTAASSPTVITRLKLLNKPVLVTDHATFLPVPIHDLEELVLPFSERMITFEFAAMDHAIPVANEFRFILEGLNDNWIENGTGHEATFTNLDPGHYTFRVQGRNSAGVWDPVGANLRLRITPPWWGTWWFIGLVAAVMVLLGVAFYRYRVGRSREMMRMRDRIARDLHDEIGSTLSSVALFSEVAKRQARAAEGPGPGAMLDRIGQSTIQMVESMNDIVWAVSSHNDDLSHTARRMKDFAVRMCEARGIEPDFSFQGLAEEATLDMVQRKNLYLIFKEAVNNAVKYSRCTALTIRLFSEGDEVVLSVKDDGIGMKASDGNGEGGEGNGLRNMQSRAAEIAGSLRIISSGVGTEVLLRFRPRARPLL